MHEIGIARGLLRLVIEGAEKNKARQIKAVTVKVGRYAGVEVSLLERAFGEITESTLAEGARLDIVHEPFCVYCNECFTEFEPPTLSMVCPKCGGTNTDVISGQSIELIDLEITV